MATLTAQEECTLFAPCRAQQAPEYPLIIGALGKMRTENWFIYYEAGNPASVDRAGRLRAVFGVEDRRRQTYKSEGRRTGAGLRAGSGLARAPCGDDLGRKRPVYARLGERADWQYDLLGEHLPARLRRGTRCREPATYVNPAKTAPGRHADPCAARRWPGAPGRARAGVALSVTGNARNSERVGKRRTRSRRAVHARISSARRGATSRRPSSMFQTTVFFISCRCSSRSAP